MRRKQSHLISCQIVKQLNFPSNFPASKNRPDNLRCSEYTWRGRGVKLVMVPSSWMMLRRKSISLHLRRWRTESLLQHDRGKVLNLPGDRLPTEVKLPVLVERPRQQHHALHVGLVHGLRLVAGEEADGPGVLQHSAAVLGRCTVDNLGKVRWVE